MTAALLRRTGRCSVADVEIYDYVNGQELEAYIAHLPGVHDAVGRKGRSIAGLAEAYLDTRPKHRTGKSRVVVEHGRLDTYVILDDERDERAAAAIEYGNKYGGGNVGALRAAIEAAGG